MKILFYLLRTFVLLLLMAATALCQKEDAGTTSAAFLKLGVGARAAGLGFSALTLTEDASALYWNPAALVEVPATNLTLNFNNLYAGMKHGYLGMAFPGKDQAFGVGLVYFNSGSMTRTEAAPSGALPYTQMGTFSNHDGALMLGYAVTVTENVHIGVGLKGIYQSVGGVSAYGGAADIGVFAKLQSVDLGFAVKNLGTKIKFTDTAQALPLQILLGATLHIDDNFLVTASGGSVGEGTTQFNVGSEYRYDFVAFRVGYRTGLAEVLGSMKGLTAGLGLYFGGIRLDYAYNTFGDLGGVHLISLGFELGDKGGSKETPVREYTPPPTRTIEDVKKETEPELKDTTASEPAVVKERTGKIIPATASLFLQASAKSKIVLKVKKNDVVKILEEKESWYFVETAAGKQGWTQKKNVKATP